MRSHSGGGGGLEESVFVEYVEGFKKYIICHSYSGNHIIYRRAVYVIMKVATICINAIVHICAMLYGGPSCENVMKKIPTVR